MDEVKKLLEGFADQAAEGLPPADIDEDVARGRRALRRIKRRRRVTGVLCVAAVSAAVLAVGNQVNPDVVFFGTEAASVSRVPITIPIEVVGGLFFVLIAAVMAGPGQEMGRAFNRVASRTAAYSANLLGSLAGIGTFAACSYLKLPPVV